MPPSYEQLAQLEIERHQEHLLYKDRQQIKAGDLDSVAANLRKRSYTRLIISLVAAALLFFAGGIYAVWGAALLLSDIIDYSHTRRTQETIRRLQEAAAAEATESAQPDSAASGEYP